MKRIPRSVVSLAAAAATAGVPLGAPVAARADGAAATGPEDAPPTSALADAIEVVARGRPASRETAVPRLTLIDREEIDRRQAASVAEMLTEVPGALVLQDGPRGQFTRLFLRGAASNQTLVLVDGIPQNDATAGGLFDFNDLSTAGVERIEVLRGSYGVLYGSEAVGGVVAVTTRGGPGPWRGFAAAEGGSFSTHREALGGGGGDEDFDLWVTMANEGTQGERRREDYDANELSGRVGFTVAPSLRADFTLRTVESRLESPFDFPSFGSNVLPTDPNIERERDTLSTGLTFTHTARPWLSTRLALSYLRVDSSFDNGPDGVELIDPDFTPGTGDEVRAVRDELLSDNRARDVRVRLASTAEVSRALGWKARRDGGVEVDVTAGAEWLDQDSDSSTASPNFGATGSSTTDVRRSLDTLSGFVLAEARLPDVGPARRGVVAAGVRHDDHDVFGGETSPFVGARVTAAPTETTLLANWGEGFRAPKPAELDDPFVGNGDLGPETSTSFDVGATQPLAGGRAEVGLTWFRLDTDDLIAFDPSATSTSRPFGQLVNFQQTRTTGWELEGRAELGAGFSVRAAYTRQNPRDRETGLPLPNRSREFAGGGVSWERGRFQVSLDGTWATKLPHQGGEYVYPEPDERAAPGRMALVTLAARWRATDVLSFHARVENLLDDAWVATPTSPTGAPLSVFFGLTADF